MHLRRMAMCMLPFLLAAVLQVSSQQAYPPGVPPRQDNYQQPPPPQQQQQYQQQQYQQQPPQQHQQQQYQQQQYQQQPQYQQQQPNVQQFHQNANPAGHHHGGFKADMHNAEHIVEHLKEMIDTKPMEQMTDVELEFYFFKLNDFDNNNKLDGVEMSKALTHFHRDETDTKSPDGSSPKPISDEEIANRVDELLKEHDVNKDGYIEYPELKATQHREEPAKS